MTTQGSHTLFTCTYCGGLRRASGRVGGQVLLTCTSCETPVRFDSMDEAVQAEEALARDSAQECQLELQLI